MTAHPTRQQLERIAEERRRAALLAEKLTVLAQPHRKGDEGHMADVFGTFLRYSFGKHEQDLMQRCWEAGQSYLRKVSRLRGLDGIPQCGRVIPETPSSGIEPDEDLVAEWRAEMKTIEFDLKCSGLSAYRATKNMILDDKPPHREHFDPVKRVVTQLAITLGFFT